MAHSAKTKAKMRKAWKRRKLAKKDKVNKRRLTVTAVSSTHGLEVGDTLTFNNLPKHMDMALDVPVSSSNNGLIDRMTQAIDKIETQIKRLESL